MPQVTITNPSPELFPIGTISLAGTIFHRFYINPLAGNDFGITTLAGNDLGIIALTGDDLRIINITCHITVFNHQCTHAISHHMEETIIHANQVHIYAIKHFINQSIRVTTRQFTSSCSSHNLFNFNPFYPLRFIKWTINLSPHPHYFQYTNNKGNTRFY